VKIAVLSDIHGNLAALEAVLEDQKARGADGTVFLGDLVMNGPRPAECLALIKELQPLVWIRGNTDAWAEEIDETFIPSSEMEIWVKSLWSFALPRLAPEDLSLLASLPHSRTVEIEGIPLTFCHGSPDSWSRGLLPETPEEDFAPWTAEGAPGHVFCGHTHVPMDRTVRGVRFLNFGGISIPSRDGSPHARYGLLEAGPGGAVTLEAREVPFDLSGFFRDMVAQDFPGIGRNREKYRL